MKITKSKLQQIIKEELENLDPAGMKLDREEVAEALVQTAEAILDGARREKRISPIADRAGPRFTAGT
jgi:hypothetical protein